MEKQVLWIVSELFPPDETSTAYILGEIANALSNKYIIKVICGPEIYDKQKKIDRTNLLKLDESICIYRTEETNLDKNTSIGKALRFLIMSRRIYSLAKTLINKEDNVLIVTNPAPIVVMMGRLKHKRGFNMNILVHDVFPENTRPAGIKLPFYKFVKHVFDKAYAQADQLIVLGRDMAEVLSSKISKYKHSLVTSPKIRIIENWADTDDIQPKSMPKGHIILEYAGNIGRVQGLEHVINELPENLELHIYGTGAMEAKLKEMNRPNVFFHGPYFRRQQNDVLAACHIALVTLQDGMYGLGVPSKSYNILASGRPILFFGPENSEIYRLVKEDGIGYCEWPKSWNKDELIEMGKKARELAENRYSKTLILQKFIDFI